MRLILIIVFIMSCVGVSAQIVSGKVVVTEEGNQTPLVGATVIWAGTSKGTVTDFDGNFSLERTTETDMLVANYVGYNADTIIVGELTEVEFNLKGVSLDEVAVRGRKAGTSLNRMTALTRIDISSAELCKAACCNLGESFETNASVDVNYADAATGARTIQMLGLSGRYVQMLTENIANLRGLAAPFGLSYVPGPWMDGIQVSKGVGTVVNGYEAFTGQINIEFKKPISEELVAVNLFGSSAGRAEINANTALRVTDKLTTAFIVNASQDYMSMDENDDNFRDEPQTKQINLLNRWNYHSDAYTWQLVVKTLNEERMSGHVDFDSKTPSNELYGVYIKTDRVESWMKNGFIFSDETNLGITTSYIYHNQHSFFGQKSYDGTQHSYNINLIFNNNWGERHALHAGVSSQGDMVSERVGFSTTDKRSYSIDDISAGIFGQYTYKLDTRLSVIAGLRLDWSNQYDVFVTPRLHVRYAPWEKTIIRMALGKGYRTGYIFAENNYMLGSARQWEIEEAYGQEMAWNMGVNITQYVDLWGNELMLNAEYYRTQFLEQMIMDTDNSPRSLFAHFSDDKSYANNIQIEGKYSPFRGMEVTVAYRWNEAKQTLGGQLRQRPLVSKYKGLVTLSYATPLKKWQFDMNMQLNGGGRIPTTAGKPEPYKRAERFDPYQVFNGQITKYFRTWSIYAGVENIGNFTQKNPIIAGDKPYGEYFDASMIWGPLMSRKFYVGLRWSMDRKEK